MTLREFIEELGNEEYVNQWSDHKVIFSTNDGETNEYSIFEDAVDKVVYIDIRNL